MAAVLEDHHASPLSEEEKALFDFIEKVNRASHTITRDDVDRVRGSGWSDEAVYDAITVCALFRFFNTWVDAAGVEDMPAMAYEALAKKMARRDYDWSVTRMKYEPPRS